MNRRNFFELVLAALGLGISHAQQSPALVSHEITMAEMPPHNHGVIDPGHSHAGLDYCRLSGRRW